VVDVVPARRAGSDRFTVAGVLIASDAAVFDGGLDVSLGREVKLGIPYIGQIAIHARDNGFESDLSWKF
jgi:fibronectin-binding autotransporter adhesin